MYTTKKTAKKLVATASLLPALLMTACSGDNDNDDDTIMSFSAVAGDTAITCGAQLTNLGTGGNNATIKSMAFYIHDVEVIGDDAQRYSVKLTTNNWQQDNVALIDFADRLDSCASDESKPTNATVSGAYSLPEGTEVVGVDFKIGVPEDKNHLNITGASTPLNLADMHWNWQGGYKFIRADIQVDGASQWNIHLGSTGCNGDPVTGEVVTCNNPNRTSVELTDFSIGDTVQFDYAALVSSVNVAENTEGTPFGCMSKPGDPECVSVFAKLGLSYGDATTPASQAVFSLIDN